MTRRALLLSLAGSAALILLACNSGRPDGRLRSIREAAPAPRGGEYAVAEKVATVALPAFPVSFTINGAALYVFMNEKGIAVFDLKDPAAPALVNVVPAPPPASRARLTYLHSGAVDAGEMFVADRAGDRILVYDVRDPLAPAYSRTIETAAGPPMDILPAGDRLIAPMGGAGMIDLPRQAEGSADALPMLKNWDYVKQAEFYPHAFPARWLLVADNYDGGLRVLDFADPRHPVERAAMQIGGFCDSLLAFDGFALLANRGRGMMIVDLADPARPYLLSLFNDNSDAWVSCLAKWGAHGVVAGQRFAYFDLFDVENPKTPLWLGRVPTERPVVCLEVQGDLAYVGTQWPDYRQPGMQPETLQVWRLERRRDSRGENKIARR